MKEKMRPRIEPQFSQIDADWENQFLGMYRLPIIFGFTGPTKSGKTIMANHLVNLYNFSFISINSEIIKMIQIHGEDNNLDEEVDPDDENVLDDEISREEKAIQKKRDKFRKTISNIRSKEGNEIFAKRAMKKLYQELRNRNIGVVDGILHPDEVEYFKSMIGRNFILIGVDADRDVRAEAAAIWLGGTKKRNKKIIEERDRYEQYKVNRNCDRAPNISKCLLEANCIIPVEKFDRENLYTQIVEFIRRFLSDRSWDLS